MPSGSPTREQADLAEVLEMVLDKGIVINADVAITVGETELLGIELRAAIASFETAAKYGLAFPSGTDMRRVEQASGRQSMEDIEPIDLGIEASSGGSAAEDDEESEGSSSASPGRRPTPKVMASSVGDEVEEADEEAEDDEESDADDVESENEDDAGDEGADEGDRDDDGGDA